jgi:histidyl-tRNA synthetase
MSKPSLPQGTRDFGPDTVRKRNHILTVIKTVFELYGFQPLETPAFENLETLMGKYGDEGDKLIFRILNNGLDHPDKKEQAKKDFEVVLQGKNTKGITERALKYDLTIPFARYVAMNQGQLTFPFKRYQVQPVWRADRPQRGRYREFYQCDADVVGSNALLNELELANIYIDVFTRLKLPDFRININHRKILTALSEVAGAPDSVTEITTAIDKSEKTGIEKVKAELIQKGMTDEQVGLIDIYLSIKGSISKQLGELELLLGNSAAGKKGISDLREFFNTAGFKSCYFDPALARGLDYYTGIIFEAKGPREVQMGSIGGGGRYDDLTGLFGVPGIPGVGISFGVDRIYDVMDELNLFPEDIRVSTQVLFFHLGENESRTAFEWLQKLRARGIRSELYHETAKMDKQFRYAEKKNIPYIIIIGEKELKENTCNIKHLASGKQKNISLNQLSDYKF